MGQILQISQGVADYYIYGNKNNILQGYLAEQLNRLQPAYNEFSNRVQQALQTSYNYVTDKLVHYGIMNEMNQIGLSAVDNYYKECLSFQDLKDANYTMQRWVMCHPEVRSFYLAQNLDGYSDSYRNVFGNEVGQEDYNYRLITSDVLVSDDDDYWTVKHHLEDLIPGDKEPDHYEKVIVQNTFDTIDWILSNCKFDFTAVTDNSPKINRE